MELMKNPKVLAWLMAFQRLLLLLFIATNSSAAGECRSVRINLGCELFASKDPTYWPSDSGRFAFGFYPEGGGFRVGIWLQTKPKKTVVWTAKRDEPPMSGDSQLVLSYDGQLILTTDHDQNITFLSLGEPASSASLLDTGNFVVYGSNISKIIWESFYYPTDTIVADQILITGNELASSVSESKRSTGKFTLKLQMDGNLVLYPAQTPERYYHAYWASNTVTNTITQGLQRKLILASDGLLSLVNYSGSVIYNMSTIRSSDAELIYRATLDADGFFRLYSHNFTSNSGPTVVGKWPFEMDPCIVKGICGFNSYCGSMGAHFNCYCLPGFSFLNPNDSSGGCVKNITSQSCGDSRDSVTVLENVGWLDTVYSFRPDSTQQECTESCLEDRYCEAAFYGENNCRKRSLPLRYGKVQSNSVGYLTLIKVSTCNVSYNLGDPRNGSSEIRSKKDLHLVFVILGGVIVAVALVGFTATFLLWHRSRRTTHGRLMGAGNGSLGLTEDVSLRSFSYDELTRATGGFKEEVGRGAFGAVYKGVLDFNGEKFIAVKRLEKIIEEGEREFLTEMRSIGRTHHRNLIRLLGVCYEGKTRLLVYDYMSNGSLADFLCKGQPRLHWNERVRIAQDVARGILYLHEDCEPHIIHCDIKPQNILIDDSWTAKVSDFGLAKLLTPDQTRTFTGIRGTRGYLAPEWYKNTPISVKTDVYSFGMVLLEIICCRKNVDIDVPDDEMILSEWVYKCFRTGDLKELLKGEEEVDKKMLERMVSVALWCIQDEPALRPTIKCVISMLEGSLEVHVPPVPTS
ncbi:G-type lectin S-receptor-like serine/threonine-protein kinase LECRK3 [Aristolochia californica]|uniref:G-type lectin S-receptor-like serine/threonine-protein kinase LECRK3 n=1 Tax=Aristolochia californica TaxID=171875 RepID=UPI0035DEF58E